MKNKNSININLFDFENQVYGQPDVDWYLQVSSLRTDLRVFKLKKLLSKTSQ